MHVHSAAPAAPSQTEPPEASRLQPGPHHLSAPTHSLSAWLAVPEHLNPSLSPLVAVHGVRRGARNQARQFMQAAREQGRLVIAPLFDTHHWFGYQRILAQGQRADLALLRLLETVSFQLGVATRQVVLFGYSGGAQFAHRFAMLHPHRVAQLCTCAAGWYTWVEAGAGAFPRGLEASARRRLSLGEVAAANLGRFLQIPTWVTVGDLDNQADALTRRDPHLDALQGTHRLERAQRWVQALHSAAASRGMQASAQLHVLPDAGHDFAQCMRSGALAQLALPALAPTRIPLAA
jgi:pimeloyl-ACP methyl ester carboxylesterase